MVPADVDRALRIPGLEVELAWRLRYLLEDPVRVEADELALDLLPGVLEDLEGVRVEKLDSELADDAPPAALELAEGSLVEDLVAGHVVDQHSSLSSSRSNPSMPVSLISSGRRRRRAACSAPARSWSVGSCASHTTFS